MKKLVSIVLAFTMSSVLFAWDIAEKTEVKGPVKTVTKTEYDIAMKFGEYFRTPSVKTVNKYDEGGKVIESTETTSRDSLINKISYKYDASGNLSEIICLDSENVQLWNTVNTYKNGKIADSSEYGKGGALKGRTIYGYTDGNLTDESYYNGEGTLVYKVISKYIKNILSVEEEYFEDGSLSEERQFAYNDDGKIDAITYIDRFGRLAKKDVFRYSNKVLSEIITYSPENKPVARNVVKFDERGNPVKITMYDVVRKFGQTINEISDMSEIVYEY